MKKMPILLSFSAIASPSHSMVFGQLTYLASKDFSFKNFGRRKTFRKLFQLYRSKPYANQQLRIEFENERIAITTDASGGFYLKQQISLAGKKLSGVILSNGDRVEIIEGLYDPVVHSLAHRTIVISDIDDTLLHSYIYRKIKKFRTLVFTPLEKRKVVESMRKVLSYYVTQGAFAIYLSNSEQNLYPIIYRFLAHNNFPKGPILLKNLRNLWHVFFNKKSPLKNLHKLTMLNDLITCFADQHFILIGDNTQEDIEVYSQIVSKHSSRVNAVVIRKVVETKNEAMIDSVRNKLTGYGIKFYYDNVFAELS
jgi:phosphatidate phosphatase APP1